MKNTIIQIRDNIVCATTVQQVQTIMIKAEQQRLNVILLLITTRI
jgi:hypothetical protein